jgi:hypothetical protein
MTIGSKDMFYDMAFSVEVGQVNVGAGATFDWMLFDNSKLI